MLMWLSRGSSCPSPGSKCRSSTLRGSWRSTTRSGRMQGCSTSATWESSSSRGPEALDLIQKITVNDASKLEVWQAQYSAMCLENGGIIDDLLVYRGPDHYMLVVNASNKEKDLAWVLKHAAAFDVEVTDKSDDTALLAIQGPQGAGDRPGPHRDEPG